MSPMHTLGGCSTHCHPQMPGQGGGRQGNPSGEPARGQGHEPYTASRDISVVVAATGEKLQSPREGGGFPPPQNKMGPPAAPYFPAGFPPISQLVSPYFQADFPPQAVQGPQQKCDPGALCCAPWQHHRWARGRTTHIILASAPQLSPEPQERGYRAQGAASPHPQGGGFSVPAATPQPVLHPCPSAGSQPPWGS